MGTDSKLLEAVVIGSGFGGAISFCRLAQKWNSQVLLLERGKRYPMGSFPRSPHAIAQNFWNPPGDTTRRPRNIRRRKELRGMYDIRNYERMDVVVCAGLGGGSLIYSNVFLEPPEQVFSRGWPPGLSRAFLKPYYDVARQALGARPIPDWNDDPRRRIIRTELFEDFARNRQRTSTRPGLCVFFGNDFQDPTPIGIQEQNRHGATQTSCTYCGECNVGCNIHSKNTLDLNYLHVAEQVHKARIQTESVVLRIVPLNAAGNEDSGADGAHGYRVHYSHLDSGPAHVDARRVVVSAGTLGTNELLLRCRDEFRTLPRLSQQLGRRFSGNGDFVAFAASGDKPADPNYGPVITQYIDFNLYDQHQPEHAFIMEDASYPPFVAWFTEGLQPALNPFGVLRKAYRLVRTILAFLFQRVFFGKWTGPIGNVFHRMLKGDASYHLSVLLCMGQDKGDGVMTVRDGNLFLDWPQKSSMPLYQSIMQNARGFRDFVRARFFTPLPTWFWPLRNNITVHPLGGCALADTAEHGVVSANAKDRGQAFGYYGLYVADGSLLPTATGANPVATISALSEWIAQGIVENPNLPSHDLKDTLP